MKKIGNTETGGVIVEMTRQEAYDFEQLGRSIEGHGWNIDYALRGDAFTERNLYGVFGVIRAFYLSKYKVNEMRQLFDDMEHTIGTRRDGQE